jgi:hypothetical protein
MCTLAAGNEHLEVLKYAHENGSPWDTLTCSVAAELGDLETLLVFACTWLSMGQRYMFNCSQLWSL